MKSNTLATNTQKIPVFPGVATASSAGDACTSRLSCGIQAFDQALGGGIALGSLVEWGAPLGQGGRELLIPWIRALIPQSHAMESTAWVLWVYEASRLMPYAPAWAARGVALERLRFAQTGAPLVDLQAVFLEPFFRMIILDVAQAFSAEEYAFITRQARLHHQIVMIIRDRILSPDQGNIWARVRLNTWSLTHPPTRYHVEILKGSSTRSLDIVLP